MGRRTWATSAGKKTWGTRTRTSSRRQRCPASGAMRRRQSADQEIGKFDYGRRPESGVPLHSALPARHPQRAPSGPLAACSSASSAYWCSQDRAGTGTLRWETCIFISEGGEDEPDSVSRCSMLRHRTGIASEHVRASTCAATKKSTSGGSSRSMLGTASEAIHWFDIVLGTLYARGRESRQSKDVSSSYLTRS